jgi:eukaryotic-like serine/threonine-protein kinase
MGKYTLIRKIGEGATGQVYFSLDTFTGQEVAIKVVDKSILNDPEFNEECHKQFKNEASLAGRLAHPHIVTILEASISEDSGYIVMEYVAGGNLSRYTRRDSLLPVENVLQIIFKCCGALDYAYRQGIIHRDIKPANILMPSSTEIKITDFGAAVFHTAQVTQKVVMGSPYYMSLEQIRGNRLTCFSDMYALGVVAYELLTGTLPFDGGSLIELFDEIANKTPLPPSAHLPELPPELDRIILKMIARRPEDRYPNWADLALEIAGIGRFSKFHQGIPDSDKFGALRAMKNLGEFSEPEIWELVQASKWTNIPARTVILRENEPGHSLYLLASGQIKVIKQGRLLNIIQAGEYFGEMAYILRGSKRRATLEALSDLVVAEFPFEALENLSDGCRLQLANSMLVTMSERLSLADDRIAQMHG